MKKREEFLPFALPFLGIEEEKEIVDCLRSGWITMGPKTKKFEQQFSRYIENRNAIAVNSCTAALHIALSALGISRGDEVIVPTLTFCSTANVVVHLGARPVLVDIGEDYNVTPEAIEKAISKNTKAIIIVHYGGQACNIKKIYEIASAHKLPIIEDAAHAVGAQYLGNKIGSAAIQHIGNVSTVITCFSFYATKNMTTGEGGMIVTDNDDLASRMRLLVLHGMSKDAWKRYASAGSWYYEVVLPGYKYNMTDLQAALGIHQLKKLEWFIEKRQYFAKLYDEAFCNLDEIDIPVRHNDRTHTYHLYAIRLKLDKLKIDRCQFIEELRELNIGVSVHFIPIHLHPFYMRNFGYRRGDFPVAENIYDRIISLPLYPKMKEDDIKYVIDAIYYLVEKHKK
jgi:dTDP-4-amino-4,6-dideoxygalactose transaminase